MAKPSDQKRTTSNNPKTTTNPASQQPWPSTPSKDTEKRIGFGDKKGGNPGTNNTGAKK